MTRGFARTAAASAAVAVLLLFGAGAGADDGDVPMRWKWEFPKTDFTRHSVSYDEILSGGPPRDGIPSIDDPSFVAADTYDGLAATEPVIGVKLNGMAKAYPLRVLTWHEIVNDEIDGVPVAVTYCPLCNAGIVFDRRVGGRVLEFGTTGRLRMSDLIMYDRETGSWWQQYTGEAIVGRLTGSRLEVVPARLESFARFKARAPGGQVLVPNDPSARDYGRNPYAYYDTREFPYGFYQGPLPEGIDPMVRVVVVNGRAWSLRLLRAEKTITAGDIRLSWHRGQNSALDAPDIADGRDVGNVVVEREGADGIVEDVPHEITFAFVYHAFHPGRTIATR